MRVIFALLVAAVVPLAQGITPASAPANSKVWVGHYADYEQFLQSVEINGLTGIGVGVTEPRRASFAPGSLAGGATWKPLTPGKYRGSFESYKSEIAAYKIDRVLELDMVPPTVERTYKGETGSLQLWVENVRTLKQIQAAKLHAPDTAKWNAQVNRQKAFDDLIANIDPNQGNMLFDPDWNMIKVDHSRAFTNTSSQPFEVGKALNPIDRPFFDRLKALDRTVVDRELGDLLENGAVGAILARRDAMVKGFDKLIRSKGEAAVFVGP